MSNAALIQTANIIAKIESGNWRHAVRFEPGFYNRYLTQTAINNIINAAKPAYMNATTAKHLLAMSWGKYQIMGENLYTICALKNELFEYVADDALQLETFIRFVRAKGIAFSPDDLKDKAKRDRFATRYNGSVAYAVKILAELKAQGY